jgi:acyl carrier protein
VPEVSFAAVLDRIGALVPLPSVAPTPDTALHDIVRESFALVELLVDIQEEFSVFFTHEELSEVNTLGELTALVKRSSLNQRESAP